MSRSKKSWISGIEVGRAAMLDPGQVTVFAARDGADIRAGILKGTDRYQVNTTGPFANTTAVYLPCFAQSDLIFTVIGRTITSVIGGLDIVKAGDRIRIRGSTLNDTSAAADGCYLVTTALANTITLDATTPPAADENSVVPITIAKQALQSNNTVVDLNTSRPDKPPVTWSRYGSYLPAKLGAGSDGKLYWTATAVSVHAANNDLKVTAGGKGLATFTIIGGAGEILRYWPGYSYSFTVFANAVNKLPGFRCISVTVNGADLDLLMDTGNITVATEAGPINGVINLSCNDIWSFANACIAAGVGGYSDWRVPNVNEESNLIDWSINPPSPNQTAFPSYLVLNDYKWSSTTPSNATTSTIAIRVTTSNYLSAQLKTGSAYITLLRGGV